MSVFRFFLLVTIAWLAIADDLLCAFPSCHGQDRVLIETLPLGRFRLGSDYLLWTSKVHNQFGMVCAAECIVNKSQDRAIPGTVGSIALIDLSGDRGKTIARIDVDCAFFGFLYDDDPVNYWLWSGPLD
jgi:hypothetical protein